MADNVELNAGSGGAVIASDDDGTAQHQYVKIEFGADNTQTKVTSSAGLPVTPDSSGFDVTNAGTFAVQADSVTPGTAAANLGKAEDAAHATGDTGVMALAVRRAADTPTSGADGDYEPLKTDANGHLKVEIFDGGDTHTITGTVTANLGVTDNAVLDSIDAAVNGTLTVGSHAVTNAGTFAVQEDGAALTALQLIDDTIFADDAAFTLASSKVSMAGAVRDDALSTLTAVEGDAVPLRVSSTGALHVTGGGGGTEYNEDDATPNPIVGTATMMERDDALSTLTPIEGDFAALRCNARGALWVEHDTTTAIPITDNSGSLTVDGTVAVSSITTSITPGTAAANLGKAEDAAHASGDTGVMALAVRTGTPTNRSGTDGDYEPLQISSGRLWTSSTVTSLVPGTTATSLGKAEDAAHSSGDTGVMSLAVRSDTLAASSGTTGDYEPLHTTALGALYVAPSNISSAAQSFYRNVDANAEAAIKASAGVLHWLHVMNMTAAVAYLHLYNATTATVVPGTTTPTLTFPIPTQGDTNGAGFNLPLGPTGQYFSTAITLVVTTTIDGSTGDPGTNGVFVNAGYT